MSEVVIVAGARSAIGRAQKGKLTGWRPDDLAAHVVAAAVARAGGVEIEDVILGCAQPAGEAGYNVARAAALLAGLDAPGVTVNRYCASSMQAIRMAAHAIRAGEGEVFVAGGVDCVSRYDRGKADGHPDTKNPRFGRDLPDLYLAMGLTAERVAESCEVSREEMDRFAALSQERALAARAFHAGEIVPTPELAADEGPRPGTTVERLAELKPAFRDGGRVTAGNACPLNDGAAAVVVMSEARARALGLAPLGRVVSTAVSSLAPEVMGLGPIEASRRALARAGLTIDDVDLVEINEAFAAQVIPSARALGVPWERLNVNGGAIALGHPFGMTGARLVFTLLRALEQRGGRRGLAALCVGGGQGMAMVVERAG
jgi:acetyl-CoA C-acetyltransferase